MRDKNYNIIIVLDTIEDKIIPQSLELISCADKFSSGDLSSTLLIVPGKNTMKLCGSISEKYGIDSAALEHVELYYPNPELLQQALSGFIDDHKPDLVLFSHTVRNCQIAGKLSVSLKASSVTAVEYFIRDNEGHVFQRSIFNGKLKENVRLKASVKIAAILPGAYTPAEEIIPYNDKPSVIQIGFTGQSEAVSTGPAYTPEGVKQHDLIGYKPLSVSSEAEGGVKLEDADVIVSAGRGIGKVENLQLIREIASIFENAAIGASRPICDNRWLPFNQQVGITGRTVSPKLYLACGISGSQQHIAGMKNSLCIAAINKDPNAAIFSIADYIIVEDLVSFLPVLVKKYRERFGE